MLKSPTALALFPCISAFCLGLSALFTPGISWGAPIKVGSSDVTSSSGIFIAQEKGFFKEQGLDVQISIVKASGAPMTALLARGELDVGGGNLTSGLFSAKESGVDLKMVADKGMIMKDYSHISLLVRADHVQSGRYKSFKDLKGFRMAVNSLTGVSQEITTDRFLQAGGLTLKDIQLVKMSYAEMNAGLMAKTIDATVQLEPYTTEMELRKAAVRVAGAHEVYPGQPTAVIIFSPKFARERPEEAVKFLAAYIRGVRAYLDAFRGGGDKKGVIAILKRYIDIRSDEVWEKMSPAGLSPDGTINRAELLADLDWYKRHGYLKELPDLDQVIDHSFLDRALKISGRANEASHR